MSGVPGGLERLRNRRVAIWGTGVEGREVARAALSIGADVCFVDDRHDEVESLTLDGHEFMVASPEAITGGGYDCIVRSPGVSVYRDELTEARRSGSVVTSATAMWLEDFAGSRIVGVTGTKGKTTTAWLTTLVLEACGLRVRLGGNMGTPLTALYSPEPTDVYVLEISSFQAADVTVSPPVGILTLIAPDHLDWHRGYDNYLRDKLNLFAHRDLVALAVNAASEEAMTLTEHFAGRLPYGTDGRVRVQEGAVLCEGAPALDTAHFPLRGEHNLVNLCGALSASLLLGVSPPDVAALSTALEKMPVLPSRLETVGEDGGVEFVNDALASNPAGTLAALRTFNGRRVCLIVGGQDRGVAVDPLVREISIMRPAPSVVSLPGLGARISSELQSSGQRIVCEHALDVAEAVVKARALLSDAGAGVVLFSPAAPTPTSEGSYLQRGAAFNAAVREIVDSAR